MTHAQAHTKSSVSLLFIRVLGALALGVSAYLLYGSLTGERLAGCGPEAGCDAALRHVLAAQALRGNIGGRE